ncbi:hypothetical protein CROQUDRAFT_136388 [Cronartium quercuum f. sp. fusiforme G11]|uniref:Uncharacterized protein n=1 Tax=Cronartium quercuum f. sp. fusiforme G11 TaxID=708437 RepID=A0A9P6N716_9BASI|nr:hypothetical protein CROQUDRAFT_136388 [Cronartium quercuum f. sp. fusiforme G11]
MTEILKKKWVALPPVSEEDKKWNYIQHLVHHLTRLLATSFLRMLKLIHDKEIDSQSTKELLLNGWSFLCEILDEWKILDLKHFFECHSQRKTNYLNGTQSSVLLAYLAHSGKMCCLPMSMIWKLWLRWYKKKTYAHKRFYATEAKLYNQLEHSLTQRRYIEHDKSTSYLFQFGKVPLRSQTFKALLKQHIFQKSIKAEKHIGQLESQLLEHHVDVTLWFDKLSQSLQSQLYGLKPELRKSLMSTITKILHLHALPASLDALDPLMNHGWTVLKQQFEQWKGLYMPEILLLTPPQASTPLEILHSRTLFKNIQNNLRSSHIRMDTVWPLLLRWYEAPAPYENRINYLDEGVYRQKLKMFNDIVKLNSSAQIQEFLERNFGWSHPL